MASAHEFVVWKRETSGTFPDSTIPNRRTPVTSLGFDGGPELKEIMTTDSVSRARVATVKGSTDYTASLSMPFYPTGLAAHLFASAFNDIVATEAETGAWQNDLLPLDNNQQLQWFTMQSQYNPSYATNAKGMILNTATITQAVNEVATLDFDFIVNDFVAMGETWADETPAPAIIDIINDTTIENPLPKPFRHFQVELVQGGTLVKTGNEVKITGGTAISCLQNFSITFPFNTTPIHCIGFGDGTSKATYNGQRAISINTTMTWYIENSAFWSKMKNGTPTALQLTFISDEDITTGPTKYTYNLVIPKVKIPKGQANIPALTGDKAMRTTQITFESEQNYQDSVFDGDFAMSITVGENLNV